MAQTDSSLKSEVEQIPRKSEVQKLLKEEKEDDKQDKQVEELSNEVESGLKLLSDIYMVEIEYAYHVTNVPQTDPVPDWKYLESKAAEYPQYNGDLVGTTCVFFTTSKYKDGLPTISPYPANGDPGTEYWRVKVAINRFDKYSSIWFIHETMSVVANDGSERQTGVKQVLLVMARKEDEKFMESLQEINPKICKQSAEPYLKRTKSDGGLDKYYSNEYKRNGDKTFVNFAVIKHNFPLDLQWDTVPHWNQQ